MIAMITMITIDTELAFEEEVIARFIGTGAKAEAVIAAIPGLW